MSNQMNPQLTAIVQEYGNCPGDFIADCALPRVKVCTDTFTYRKMDEKQWFETANDLVHKTSKVHEVDYDSSLENAGKLKDRGLEKVIPMQDLVNCDPCTKVPFDEKAMAAKYLMNKIKLNREIRVASKIFDNAKYVTGNITTLTGSQQFSDSASELIETMDNIREGSKYGLNAAVMSLEVFNALRRHPQVLGSTFALGTASKEQVAAALGLDKICVGNAKMLDPSGAVVKLLGKKMLLFPTAMPNSVNSMIECPQPIFGFSAYRDAVAKEWFDETVGLYGAVRIKVGESIDEVILDYSLAHLIDNAVA